MLLNQVHRYEKGSHVKDILNEYLKLKYLLCYHLLILNDYGLRFSYIENNYEPQQSYAIKTTKLFIF